MVRPVVRRRSLSRAAGSIVNRATAALQDSPAVSTLAAMTRYPAALDGVRCIVSLQPVTPRYIAERRLAVLGLGDRLDDFNTLLRLRTSIGLERRVP